ncbi:hypothetical protein [Streptomyces sp. AC555_RSS877]|uniref:hypothetical protein n=1 Tax=Streptomyces sp. AC555_RSS877 TaxID=2823688 RepID=UPI0020B76651|nr:hypothetical protein [Streptomyces sp. AC555_RSS877]
MREYEDSLAALGSRLQVQLAAPQQVDSLLERILAEPQQATRRAGRSRQGRSLRFKALAVAGVSTAALAAVVAGNVLMKPSFPEPAYAATPPLIKISAAQDLPAAQALEDIARRTEKLRETAGWDNHFVQETWSLTTRIGGHQITSAVVPERRDSWKKDDGSIVWSAKAEKPEFQNTEQKDLWEQQWAALDEPTNRSGKGGSSYGNPPAPVDMKKWLQEGSPGDTAGFISESLVQKLMTNHLTPGQRAAVLRVLAERKDLKFAGTAKDRSGREGDAFTVESDSSGLPAKHTLIIDPDNGKVLAYEQTLTSDPGALNVKTPAVINYVTFLRG